MVKRDPALPAFGAFGLTAAEFQLAREAALEAVRKYGDFRDPEEFARFMANPWNDHVSIQAAVETVKRMKARG